MIYLDNITDLQMVYIPREETATSSTPHLFTLQSKDYEITENGLTKIRPDVRYDGISGGSISVYVTAATGITPTHLNVSEDGIYVPTGDTVYTGVTVEVHDAAYQEGFDDGYNSGYTVGYNEGYSSGYTSGQTVGYNSGHTVGYREGYSSGSIDGYASGQTVGYNSGHTVGYREGYSSGSTDGYTSGQTVGYNSGHTVGYQEGYSSGRTDGYASGQTVGYNTGYASGKTDGYNSGYTYGHTVGYNEGYASGQTSGYNSGYTVGFNTGYASGKTDGYASGITYQKSLLVSTAITENGTYTREDGFSAITVNVPTGTPINNQTKSVVLSTGDTAVTVTYNSGYTGLESVEITRNYSLQQSANLGTFTGNSDNNIILDKWTKQVNFKVDVDTASIYESGYNSGVTHQKSLLSSTAFTSNGVFLNEHGWSSVTVNYPVYSSGFTDITQNGTYEYDFNDIMGFNGAWEKIRFDVKVPLTGGTGVLDSLTVNQNNMTYYPPQGIDGYSAVTVSIDTSSVFNSGYTSGVTDGFSSGYTSGVTDGYSSGYTSGVAYQKSLLVSTAVTSNGTYTRENGYSAVTVNVPFVVTMTQAEYDALQVKDPNKIYLIKD